MGQELLYLSQEEVVRCGAMSMEAALQDLEEVFRLYDKGDYLLPGKVVMKRPEKNSEETTGRINAMPAYIGGDFHMSGIKWIGSGPQNPFKYGLPRASAIIVLNDPVTMVPVAIMDGTVISAMRTGAVTGICAKYLAPSQSRTVSLFGAGPQNRTQLLALHTALSTIEEVYVYDPASDRSQKFAEEMSARTGLSIHVASDRLDAIQRGDILVTATTSTEPIIHGSELQKGCYVAHIGGNEVDEDLILKADKIVLDDWESVKHRMGDTVAFMYRDGKIGDDKIYASVADLVCGRKAGRTSDDELTYTCNVGLGLYDIAIATRIYRAALEQGVGQTLTLWETPTLM